MKNNLISGVMLLAAIVALATGCTKPAGNLSIPPTLVKFMGDPDQSYQVATNPAPPFVVQLGVTGVSDEARTVAVKITSSTGAVMGTHYNVAGLGTGNTVTIPAGEVVGEFTITGVFSQYASGRKDTLLIELEEAGTTVADFNNSVKLALRGPCFDGDVTEADLNAMVGFYNNSFDAGFSAWGPYSTRVVSITPLTATTARAIINNVYDYGFGDVPFIIDWTDPANVVINVETPTVVPADAGILNPDYEGMNLVIRAPGGTPTASNSFSICNIRINLRYQLGVFDPASGTILGFFGTVATTTMRR